jgi:hypothetical protein
MKNLQTETNSIGGFDIAQLCERYPLSASHWRAEIRDGRLKAKKIGRRLIVEAAALAAYFESMPDWAPGEAPAAANEARRSAK